MVTVEFKTRIKNDSIEIPRQFRKTFKDRVRVILVADEERSATPTILDDLLAHPMKVKGFRPLSREKTHARK